MNSSFNKPLLPPCSSALLTHNDLLTQVSLTKSSTILDWISKKRQKTGLKNVNYPTPKFNRFKPKKQFSLENFELSNISTRTASPLSFHNFEENDTFLSKRDFCDLDNFGTGDFKPSKMTKKVNILEGFLEDF